MRTILCTVFLIIILSNCAVAYEWADSIRMSPYYAAVSDVEVDGNIRVGNAWKLPGLWVEFVLPNVFFATVPAFIEENCRIYFYLNDRLNRNIEVDGVWLVHIETVYFVELDFPNR